MKFDSNLVAIFLFATFIPTTFSIQCWQCAATDGRKCPRQSQTTSSSVHDACITWRHGNGTILLQNVVMSQNECSQERIQFWSRFVDIYYQTNGGSVSCCFTNNCNDGGGVYPQQSQYNPALSNGYPQLSYPSRFSSPSSSLPVSSSLSFPNTLPNLNNAVPNYFQQFSERNGNCEHYFDKADVNEWIPDTLVPLAFDRASESRVGVFYVKFSDDVYSSNDFVVIRIMDKSKQNHSMYSIQLKKSGEVGIYLSTLERQRSQGTTTLTQNEDRRASVNSEISFEKSQYQGFWIAVRNGIDVSIGRIGDKIIAPVANYSDVMREGPDDPYYFGLTVSESTSADFGVNCDMPGLHFDDTCVTDDDCSEFPNTVCAAEPLNAGLDSGTRRLTFDKWREGDTLLKSCWCKPGHLRIPQSAGCYDPIRKVVTLQDGCFADYHCNDLPNTECSEDLLMPRYNKSCQCIPGNKPFLPDPRTGLVEGCAPLTDQDLASVQGCSRKFNIKNKAEWMPETYFPINQEVSSFFVKFAPEGHVESRVDDTAVIKLLDEDRGRDKMYTLKISKKGGKMALYDSRITRPFFWTEQTEREVDTAIDTHTMRIMQEDYVGFWIMYRYETGIGGQLSFGLANTPASSEYALLRWTDTSREALRNVRYIGFTNGNRQHSIDYGAMCVVFDYNSIRSPYQSPQMPYPYYQTYSANHPNSRTDFNGDVVEEAVDNIRDSSSASTSPRPIPWDIFSLIPSPTPTITKKEAVFVAPEDQKIIEPVLKNQYLTKLQRTLLPPPQHLVADFDDISSNLV